MAREQLLAETEERMKKSIEHARKELASIRSGRATTALLDTVHVDAYGAHTPLAQVASVSAPEPRLLVVQPWDKSLLSAISKAIMKADLGLNPTDDGSIIRVPVPTLTEERRKEMVKLIGKMAEEAEQQILSRRGVILDGTFVKRSQRDKILSLAHKHRIPLLAIHCMVSDELTQMRLVQRESEGKDVSDGRWEIYVHQKDVFEAFDDIPASARLELDTDATLDTLVIACEKFLRTRLPRH